MPYDQTTLETQLTAIQAAITSALANPAPNWRVGHVEMDQQDYLKYLMEQQKTIIELMTKIPTEIVDTHQHTIDSFGDDATQYVNEPQP